MVRKLRLITALAVTALVTAVGAVTASAGLLDDTKSTVGGTKDTLDDTTKDVLGGTKDTVGGAQDTIDSATGGSGSTLPGGGGSTSPAPAPIDGTSEGDTGTTDGETTTDSDGSGGGVGPGGGAGRGAGKASKDGGHGSGSQGGQARHGRMAPPPAPPRRPNGVPTKHNPSLTVAGIGRGPTAIPSFVIRQFEIPPFLLPIYQACGTQYGIPWQVLAGINKIETAFGTNLNISTAGAMGWMQFIPSSWQMYGVDANGDGRRDPYNPVDAICAAARYLKAAGGSSDLRQAIFAYNHADWYVDEVLLYARQYGRLPADLVGSLTGLTEGDRFPVMGRARYADDIADRREAPNDVPRSPTRRGINIYAEEGAPVVAVNDGTIRRVGHDRELGDYVVLQDDYGNRFTYARLGHVAKVYPVPRQRHVRKSSLESESRGAPAPTKPASRGRAQDHGSASRGRGSGRSGGPRREMPVNTENLRPRLYAYPGRPHNVDRAQLLGQLAGPLGMPGGMAHGSYATKGGPGKMELHPLREGSHVVAGTVLGRVGKTGDLASHLNFAIRPAGRGAPKINPKPILDGWKLLEDTAIYRAAGQDPFDSVGSGDISRHLLMSKPQLERRVLADPRLSIYSCGRTDIRTGQIDQRVLAGMEYLADNGFRLTVTSLRCGHSTYTASGGISEHSTGDAMDIAQVNGIPILGNQGRGSITEAVVQTLLRLQGNMEPHQIISLMDMGGPTFSMGDHADHIHVGWYPHGQSGKMGQQFTSMLKPDRWRELIGRLGEISNPTVPSSPSKYSLPARGHSRHDGD